eukprot:4493026-Alexandrium_andersonii.AAC.2
MAWKARSHTSRLSLTSGPEPNQEALSRVSEEPTRLSECRAPSKIRDTAQATINRGVESFTLEAKISSRRRVTRQQHADAPCPA